MKHVLQKYLGQKNLRDDCGAFRYQINLTKNWVDL
jgi:hypothetical protein